VRSPRARLPPPGNGIVNRRREDIDAGDLKVSVYR